MAGSVNKVILVGNLGADPDVRAMQNGGKVANLSIATSDSWKDKNTGEKKEKTEWHRVAIFNPGLVGVCENYLRKGAKVYIEGQIETRKWQDQSGQDRYTTEVVLKGYNSQLTMLDAKGGAGGFQNNDNMPAGSGFDAPMEGSGQAAAVAGGAAPVDEMEDDIPF